ncbi:MAG TPA: DUF1801 domain-containing protein [Ktedonobacterales bacterium]
MDSHQGSFQTIDEYIATFPADIQALLQAVRATIREAAPEAKERISYQISTFTLHGNLVHFAAFKRHIGFYPTSSGTAAFHDELAPYVVSKGTVRFPLDQPLPMELIARIVRFRVTENLSRAAAKAHRSKA